MTWRDHWEQQSHGGHRSQDEAFLAKEAREKLFHLGTGDALLDFGCGSADLTAYYAEHYQRVVGVDFSQSMLDAARVRVDSFHRSNVELVRADHREVWSRIAGRFDRITAGQVIQYLTLPEIGDFLREAKSRLTPQGRVILFDVIDPRIYTLVELGFFKRGTRIRDFALVGLDKLTRRLRGKPASDIGHCYRPDDIAEAADGFRVEVVWSMYYEYRYHALLTP